LFKTFKFFNIESETASQASVSKTPAKSRHRSVLQTKLNKLAIQIGKVGMCVCLNTIY
jgi:hypothetical protein